MDSLRKKLQQELLRQPDIQIQQSDSWGLPVVLITIPYTTIKRTTMDILMKMILLTVQKLDVTESKKIADFLAVEPLFIENLFNKMESAQMIELRKDRFQLTSVGVSQLQSGIYEHPPEKAEKTFYYSPCHDSILCEQPEKVFTAKVKEFRLAKKFTRSPQRLDDEQLRATLIATGAEAAEGPLQKIVDKIEIPQSLANQFIPCVEFSLYNRTENSYFTRVWNTLTEEWDERLEKLIDEQAPLRKK
ncbi:hypothetical protein CSV71_10790 [Sporosarcina sp. P21c]|uniref:hypothetical protein n=1 Tax=unclassified Sporosarcina TaxID=2647733 RepID=UPI000C16C925|nr:MULTISPECIES: hypothetical protein [unclassified Sporosarcina]PIC66318.1 hypothetical protein CSV78_12945 [Sporosarcina sp. P16a]PIC89201.1 hypothetical protein CSV71_10790 [Sporosarcina sp. P21c]PIC92270.1 hypothetical protein CSV70_11250 [Sporosarcina sp. P25]